MEIFRKLCELAKSEGYVKGGLRAIDATHIFANIEKLNFVAFVTRGIKRVLKIVKKANHKVAERLQKGSASVSKK